MRRGPLSDSYPGAVALVVCSLIPYLALTAGVFPLSQTIGKSLGLPPATLDLAIALSTGGYATGTVLAVQFAMHLRTRRMLVGYESIFVVASVLAAWAPTGDVWIAAFVAQGLCTSLMLIAAVPPLVTSWPAKKMPITGTVMNLCIFGAVAVGPSIGALLLDAKAWRPLFWAVAAVAVAALCLSLLTFRDDGPHDRDAPWDLVALSLAVVGCGAAFFGAGELQGGMTANAESLVPLIGGAALIVVLVAYEYHLHDPLMPVKAASTSVPVVGILVALTASAAAFGIMVLLLQVLARSATPIHTALLFFPEFGGAIVVAGVFGALFRTRFTPVLALGGLALVAASAALLIAVLPGTGPLVAVAAGLLGLGVAASVSPALFLVGFSLRAQMLQRVLALIELLRGVTAFLVAPILVFLAGVIAGTKTAGTADALWICLGIAAAGFGAGLALYLTGRPHLEAPDLEAWQGEAAEPAWSSPPLFAVFRPGDAGGGEPPASAGAGSEPARPVRTG